MDLSFFQAVSSIAAYLPFIMVVFLIFIEIAFMACLFLVICRYVKKKYGKWSG